MASASAAQYLSEILLDELESYSDDAHCSWIMLLPLGTYEHPKGTLNLTRAMLSEVKRNFDQKVRGVELALDYDHKASEGDSRAFGWLKSVEFFDAGDAPLKRATDHPAGLWALVEWTRIGLDAVKDHIYRYISAEYRPEWTNPVNNKTYKNVLIGATLTNRPFMNHMPAVQLTEFSTTPWGQIDKSKLPASAFLDPKNRRLPVREASGKLNIHGVRAALAAVHGAHTGHAMSGLPAGTAEKLERWVASYEQSGTMSAEDTTDTEDDQENTQMSIGPNARGVHLNKYLASADTSDEDEAEDFDLEDDEDDTDDLTADEGDVDDDYEMDDAEDEEDAADGGADEAAEGEPTEEGEPSASGRAGRSRNNGKRRRPARQSAQQTAQRGSQAMSERQEDTMTLAEAQALREKAAQADVALREIAELRASRDEMAIRLFEQAIDSKIQAWEAPANGEAGKVITTTAFNNEYKAFMLSEGFALSENTRQKVDHLLDLALAGTVELGQRSLATADMESRLTRNAAQSTDDRGVGERIEAIALEETGKPWKTLLREAEGNVKLQAANREIMKRAWRETGYTARQFGADVAAAASTTFRD